MKNFYKNIIIMSLTFMVTSCGSGVKDRVSTSDIKEGYGLTAGQIDALAANKIEEDLLAENIQDNYDLAEILFSSNKFSRLEDFLNIVCKNSSLDSWVKKYHDYAVAINGKDGVLEKVNALLAQAQDDLNNHPTSDDKKILESFLLQLNMKKVALEDRADVCSKVIKTSVTSTPGPLPTQTSN